MHSPLRMLPLAPVWITAGVLLFGTAAQAQAGTTPHPDTLQNISAVNNKDIQFARDLSILAKRGNQCIICEGAPIQEAITGEKGEQLSRLLSDASINQNEKLEKFAEAFDYQVMQKGAKLCILTKRYTDNNDLPDVTFAEVLRSTKHIAELQQSFVPASRLNLLVQFSSSLNEQQKARLQEGLRPSELAPNQQQLLRGIAYSYPLRSIESFPRVANRLQSCRTRKASFSFQDYQGLSLPVYTGVFGLNYFASPDQAPLPQEHQVVLGGWVYSGPGGSIEIKGVPGKVLLENGKIKALVPDPTTPTGHPPHFRVPKQKLTLSLDDCVTQVINPRLSASVSDNKTSSSPVKVDPDIAEKRLTIAGAGFAPAPDLLQAVMDLYGLRLVRLSNGTRQVTLPSPKSPVPISAVPSEVKRLLPAALARAFEMRVRKCAADISREAAKAPIPPREQKPEAVEFFLKAKTVQHHQQAMAAAADSLYIEAVRATRETLDPLLQKSKEGTVYAKDVPPVVLDLFALASLITCLNDIYVMPEIVPSYATHFDQSQFRLRDTTGRVGTSGVSRVEVKLWVDAEGIPSSGIGGEIAGLRLP